MTTVLASLVGLVGGATAGFVGVALVLGVATREGDLAVGVAMPCAVLGGIGGALGMPLLVRAITRRRRAPRA